MNTFPLISVIIPIYNIEQYLEKCLNSVITQTYPHLEIILVDDGSTDASSSICDKFCALDSRIRVIHKKNGGLVSARKAGTNIATGEYILFVDGDDWIEQERIQNLVHYGLASNPQMIYLAGMYRDYENSHKRCDELIASKDYAGDAVKDIFSMFLDPQKCFSGKIHWALWMWAIKTEFLKELYPPIPDEIIIGEDQACVWTCLLKASKVTMIHECSYHYVQRNDSIMHNISNLKLKSFETLYIYLENLLRKNNASQQIKKIFNLSMIALLITLNYKDLLYNNNFLYPFSKIPSGSRIIVYGAGDYGCYLVNAITNTINYTIVAWIDKGKAGHQIMGHTIQPINVLKTLHYDYIAVMIRDAEISSSVEKSLIDMGIPKQKIALMDVKLADDFHYNIKRGS